MTPRALAPWLRAALLLLCVPGCLSLSGPSRVTGTVGGSLSVQCQYEAEFTEHKKYWCKGLCLTLLKKIVETTKSEREVRSGRVSIRDDPANLTFTVTLENLAEGDEGTYWCGIDRPWREIARDVTFKVLVSVIPAPISASPTMSTTDKTSKITAKIPTVSTAWATANVTDITHITHSANIQDDFQASPGSGLHLLLTLLVLLLLLLGATSLLAWRMVRRRNKAGGYSEPPQNPSEQSEPRYANLELPTWPAQGETVRPWQAEVEYSMVQAPREDLHYTTVAFNAQHQHAEDKSPSRRPPQQEPEYSVIKRT